MSYKKVQQLADKLANTSYEEGYLSQRNKTDPFANDFLKKLRMALSELEGDLTVLKYRHFDKSQWRELGLFWHNCVEIYKNIDEYQLGKGIQELADLLNENEEWLAKIIPAIHRHLEDTEVDFTPGKYLTQARADGLQELIKVIDEGTKYLNRPSPDQIETWKPPSKSISEDSIETENSTLNRVAL